MILKIAPSSGKIKTNHCDIERKRKCPEKRSSKTSPTKEAFPCESFPQQRPLPRAPGVQPPSDARKGAVLTALQTRSRLGQASDNLEPHRGPQSTRQRRTPAFPPTNFQQKSYLSLNELHTLSKYTLVNYYDWKMRSFL